MCSSNVMAGRVYSKVNEEPQCCNSMGFVGTLLCILLIPVCIYSLLGGLVVFGAVANCLRLHVIAKYNVEDDNYFCCGSLNPCLNFVHNACNYPCSLFQMKMAMDEWDEESQQAMSPVVATPLN